MPNTPVTVRFVLVGKAPSPEDEDFLLPSATDTIANEAFAGISAGTVYIPDSCRRIGAGAFRNCPNLTKIRIPANCRIGTNILEGCTLVYVYSAPGSPAEAYCNAHSNCVFVSDR